MDGRVNISAHNKGCSAILQEKRLPTVNPFCGNHNLNPSLCKGLKEPEIHLMLHSLKKT